MRKRSMEEYKKSDEDLYNNRGIATSNGFRTKNNLSPSRNKT
jgi:hypothetical protein